MAVRLGVWDVAVIARGLTAKKFFEWEAYAQLEPFDERRADYRAASIVTMLANLHRGKDQKAYSLEDFVLKFSEQAPKRKQTPEEQFKILQLWAAAFASAEAEKQGQA